MQESPERTEQQMVDLSRTGSDTIDFFAGDVRPPPRPRRKRGPWVLILMLTLVILVVGIGAIALLGSRSGSSAATGSSYRNQAVVVGNLALTVNATGPVQGTVYNADFVVTGRISEIDVSVGQHVNAGQKLAALDTNTLPSGTNSANATLMASHAGTVTVINGAVGASSTVGGAGTHFIQIVDTSSLQINANISEADIAKVAVNDTVQFSVDAYGSQQFSGTVTAIAPQGSSTSGVVTYPVTVSVDMTKLNGANLLPGMTATLLITTATRSNVLLVPAGAITFAQTAAAQGLISQAAVGDALSQARQQLLNLQNGSNAQDNPSPAVVLEVVNGQGVARPVVVGLTDGTMYEVLAGLAEGETVVTSVAGASGTPASQSPGGGG